MMGRLPTRERTAVPRLATSLKEMRVTSISAGYAHSVAVTDQGRAFSSGQNDRGQVKRITRSLNLERVPFAQPFQTTFVRAAPASRAAFRECHDAGKLGTRAVFLFAGRAAAAQIPPHKMPTAFAWTQLTLDATSRTTTRGVSRLVPRKRCASCTQRACSAHPSCRSEFYGAETTACAWYSDTPPSARPIFPRRSSGSVIESTRACSGRCWEWQAASFSRFVSCWRFSRARACLPTCACACLRVCSCQILPVCFFLPFILLSYPIFYVHDVPLSRILENGALARLRRA